MSLDAASVPSPYAIRNPVLLIPARLAASRLPDKPLAEIAGVPMIVHVWRLAVSADCGPVVVASADRAIAAAIARSAQATITGPQSAFTARRQTCTIIGTPAISASGLSGKPGRGEPRRDQQNGVADRGL